MLELHEFFRRKIASEASGREANIIRPKANPFSTPRVVAAYFSVEKLGFFAEKIAIATNEMSRIMSHIIRSGNEENGAWGVVVALCELFDHNSRDRCAQRKVIIFVIIKW